MRSSAKLSHDIHSGGTLLNLRLNHDLVATKADVDAALEIWNFLGRSQQYGIPPQMLDFYDNMIVPAYIAKRNSAKATAGITIDDLAAYCYGKTGEMLNRDQVRKQYLPVLEQANLISYEKDPNDKRKMVIAPLVGQLNVNNSQKGEENE